MDFEKLGEYQYLEFPIGIKNHYEGLRTDGLYSFSAISAILRHYPLEKIKDSKILDYGAGAGRLAKLISPYSYEYYCSDISAKFLKDCKNNLIDIPQCKYHQILNPPYLNFEDNYFEFTFSYLSLFLDTKDLFKKAILEIDRVSQNFCINLGNIKHFELGPLLNKKELLPMGNSCLSIEEIKEIFNSDNYIFEILSPEPSVHPGSLFLYKVSKDAEIHLKFGPHIYEKGSHHYINMHKIKILGSFKKLLSIKPIEFIKYLKIKIFKFKGNY